jgi:hypothetical protein
MNRIAAIAVAALLLLAGCGDDDNETTSAATTTPAPAPTGATGDSGADDAAIQDAILGYLLEGDCETMSDQFLEDQTFVTDGREQACAAFEELFTPPAYTAEDVVISDIEVDGDKATAVVGDNISNVEATYELTNVDGQWQIDSVDL